MYPHNDSAQRAEAVPVLKSFLRVTFEQMCCGHPPLALDEISQMRCWHFHPAGKQTLESRKPQHLEQEERFHWKEQTLQTKF